MAKYVVYETKPNGKDYVLATCSTLAEAMNEQKRRRKIVAAESVVGVMEKDQFEFVRNHNLKKGGK